MKKTLILVLALALALTAFAGCGKKEDNVLKVGATPAPHAEILAVAKEILAEDGITLEIVEYNDYVLPNTATEDGDIDANFFQHTPYLNDFNAENGTHLVSVAAIHYEPLGIYAGKTASLADLKEGATVAIPDDGTNEARALKLLEAQGLITLDENADFTATVLNIVDNPLNLDIQEIEAAQVPRTLQDVDIAVINGNYAIDAGLDASLILATEDPDSEAAVTYANILVVKEGNEDNEQIQALIAAMQTEEVRTFIEETYGVAIVPMF